MITNPTVFILGAGASRPYGFPTGAELKDRIKNIDLQEAIRQALLPTKNSNHSTVWKYILNKYGNTIVEQFFNDFAQSGRYSIDAYLEHRPKYIPLGKALISMQLIARENDQFMRAAEEKGEDWYQYIYNRMNATFDDLSKNNLSVITFNYDRSFEHYLLTRIQSDYGKTIEEAASVLGNMEIIHVHGNLGNLPAFEQNNSREYTHQVTPEGIKVCVENIKIVYEKIYEDDLQFKRAVELLSEAYNVWFLGFGYDETNMRRLQLPDSLKNANVILGSTYGLRKGQKKKMHSLFKGKYPIENLYDSDLDNLSYLLEYADFIT